MIRRVTLELEDIKTINAQFDVEYDDYILFNARYQDFLSAYWVMFEHLIQGSFLEIGLYKNTGMIYGISLLSYSGEIKPFGRFTQSDQPTQKGLPTFSLEPWLNPYKGLLANKPVNHYIHAKCDFEVEMGKYAMRVVLRPKLVKHKIEISENIACEFDEQDYLCSILVKGFTEQQLLFNKEKMNHSRENHLQNLKRKKNLLSN